MKIIEMRLREIGFVLWGHCQNLLDDPRIKETKRFGHTFVRSFGRTDGGMDGRTDNVKTVYPPTNIVCGGYNNCFIIQFLMKMFVVSTY